MAEKEFWRLVSSIEDEVCNRLKVCVLSFI